MLKLHVNGQERQLEVDPARSLLWVVREDLGLTGTKYGCGVGVCGICTVHLDGVPVRSCVLPAGAAAGRRLTTIEGLAADHPLLRAWVAEQVPQCGYCQPGQLLCAAALLARNPRPDDAAIAAAMGGVLCRCGTYPRIVRAIRRAAAGDLPAASAAPLPPLPAGDRPLVVNPWVRLHADGTVTVVVDRSEMGQGIATALAMLVAEELEIDLGAVRPVPAPVGQDYVHPLWGEQLTGGSASVRGAWPVLRRAGAQARELLRAAAAAVWAVDPGECAAADGAIRHGPSGCRLAYADLLEPARELPVPADPTLKDPAAFRLIGRPVPRLDLRDLCTGRTVFALDLDLPGARVASVEHCPVPGGRLRRLDPARALALPGVLRVLPLPSGVAVVARDVEAALAGRRALDVEWQPGRLGRLSSAGVRDRLQQGLARRGRVVQRRGDAPRVLRRAGRVIRARYETPYLAHACMEPMSACARVAQGRCELWVGTQAQGDCLKTAREVTGLPPEAITVHTLAMGGGFGRRLEQDFVAEVLQIAAATGEPVRLFWTRQDDMRHDRYRPAGLALLAAALDPGGLPAALTLDLVGPELALDGVHVPYAIPHYRERHVLADPGLPTGPWRSVGASQNAFAIESFVDELARAAGRDPCAYRLDLLAGRPRERAVLEAAARAAGWDRAPPAGLHRGLALYHCFHSTVAQVVEISLEGGGVPRVHRVVCAVDCGRVVSPDGVVAQVEGAVVFGLSAALHGEITLAEGLVQQSSFADYRILTLPETPAIEVHILPGTAPPTGVGEPPVPPVAPALANALFAASGQRLRRLPLRLADGADPG